MKILTLSDATRPAPTRTHNPPAPAAPTGPASAIPGPHFLPEYFPNPAALVCWSRGQKCTLFR